MVVKLTKIDQTSDTSDMPTETVAVAYSTGINAVGGTYEYLTLRGDMTFSGAGPVVAGDMSNLVNSLRVIVNGEPVFDYRAGVASNAGTIGGLGYLLNSIGGKAYEVPDSATVREFYWSIPIGRVYPENVNRIEIIISWAAAANAISSGSMEWWLKLNDATQVKTTVSAPTTFTHAVGINQVIVRIPQTLSGGVVSGILCMNDSAADELGSQGVRINALSDYGQEANQLRMNNGDLANGIEYHNGGGSGSQTYATQALGTIFIPTYGLTGGDVAIQCDSTTATTRTWLPVITQPIGGKQGNEVRQTQKAPQNTAKAILRKTE